MPDAPTARSGAGPWLVFLFALVALAAAAAGWLYFQGARPPPGVTLDVTAPPAAPVPSMPDAPKLPARTNP